MLTITYLTHAGQVKVVDEKWCVPWTTVRLKPADKDLVCIVSLHVRRGSSHQLISSVAVMNIEASKS